MYVIDSSVWIHIGRNHPQDIFVSLWEHIDESITSGLICSPDEVLRELEQGHDTLAAQLSPKAGLFRPLDTDLQTSVTEVLARCPTIIDPESDRNRADPFVVALAKQLNHVVVSNEKPRRGETGRIKIPDACTLLAMRQPLDWFGFLRDVGWRL